MRTWNMRTEGKSMSDKQLQPEVIVFAGPNGSGKSTIKLIRINAKYGEFRITEQNHDDRKSLGFCNRAVEN